MPDYLQDFEEEFTDYSAWLPAELFEEMKSCMFEPKFVEINDLYILYQKVLEIAKTTKDYLAISLSVSIHLDDEFFAKDIYLQAESVASSFNDYQELAWEVWMDFDDREWANKLFTKAFQKARRFPEFIVAGQMAEAFYNSKKLQEKFYEKAVMSAKSAPALSHVASCIYFHLKNKKRASDLFYIAYNKIKTRQQLRFLLLCLLHLDFIKGVDAYHFIYHKGIDFLITDRNLENKLNKIVTKEYEGLNTTNGLLWIFAMSNDRWKKGINPKDKRLEMKKLMDMELSNNN